ncbi:glycosyltransferase family 4 protein [Nocardioides montaniterrae]
MKIAIVTESFLPQVNGVTNTVVRTVDRLVETGHQVVVIAPGPGPTSYAGVDVVRVRSVAMPGYRSFRVGLPDRRVADTLAAFRPDVVHLASPAAIGMTGLRAAERLGLPTVAVYQTDLTGFADHYNIPATALIDRWTGRLHRRCDRTLVPSSASHAQLAALGVPQMHTWRRGVDLDQFDPAHRCTELRATWTGGRADRVLVGYVGRLAAEKEVQRLREVADLPGVELVVIGDGPDRGRLQRGLPHATFTGMLSGAELASAYASLDVFVHTGRAETFCQTVQEAQASGVPVVAPASGGPLDLVEDGRTGLLYDPDAAGALRSAVDALVGDAVLRARLADAAVDAVADRSWASVIDQLTTVHYPAVIGGPTALAA